MNYFKSLKTSDKITFTFSLFNLFSLIVLLFSINIVYFFIWYNQIKQDSLYDMNINYNSYLNIKNKTKSNKEAFKNYILSKDTIVKLTDENEIICSPGVAAKIHKNPKALDVLMNSFFYEVEGKTYFIFNKTYKDIGEVSIMYDTTEYFHSQMIIIKVSSVIIFVFIFLNYFLGKAISRFALRELKNMADKVSYISLDDKDLGLKLNGPDNDEIRILGEALNKSFDKIQKQSETQKQFITDVAHEFKTPLMILNSKIDLYKKAKSLGKKADIEKLLIDIKTSTKKLNKLLETMFFISRIQDNSISLNNEKINIKTVIENLFKDLKILYSEKEIDLQLDIKDNFLLNADKTVFNILIENLLTNAIKFNDNNVVLKIYNKGNNLYIEDNGNGIEKDKLESIWGKFKRFDTNIEGFGVGLFLVKRISEIYNWSIDVESKVGKGTKFIIKF